MTKTILTFLFGCWFITALAQPKSYRIIETYNLRDSMNSPYRYRGEGIAALLLTAAREGKVEVFLPGEGGLVKTTREQISKNLIMVEGSEFPSWESNADYIIGDRVTYQGKQFEALDDVMDRSNPENRDIWVEIHFGPVEFSPQDIFLKIEYIKQKKSRTNLYVHLIARDERLDSYRLIVVLKYEDCLKVLNESQGVWFRFKNKRQGQVTGSIYAFEDPYFQNELNKTLIQFGIVSPAGVKTQVNKDSIAKVLNNPDDRENLLNRCYLHFKNSKTGIESINVFFDDFGIQRAPEKLFEISFSEFLKKQPAMGGFSGFKSYTQVLMGNLLKPMSADTLAIEKSSKLPAAVLLVANDFSKGQYAYVQHIQYDLTLGPNRELLSWENPIGKYIIDAILNGSFEKKYTAFKDIEMREKIDHGEINSQIIMRPGVRFDYWDPQVDYYVADLVSFNEKNYECIMDHRGKSPADSPDSQDYWGISNMGDVLYYIPRDFIRIDLGLKTIFNQSGQIISRNPESFRFLLYDQTTGLFRPVMSISYETLKEILTNPSAGSTGPKYLKLLENGKMTGFLRDTSPILWLKN